MGYQRVCHSLAYAPAKNGLSIIVMKYDVYTLNYDKLQVKIKSK